MQNALVGINGFFILLFSALFTGITRKKDDMKPGFWRYAVRILRLTRWQQSLFYCFLPNRSFQNSLVWLRMVAYQEKSGKLFLRLYVLLLWCTPIKARLGSRFYEIILALSLLARYILLFPFLPVEWTVVCLMPSVRMRWGLCLQFILWKLCVLANLTS